MSVSSQYEKSLRTENASTICSDKDDGSSIPSVVTRKAIASHLVLSPTYSDKAKSIILRARMEELEHAHQLEGRMGAEINELTKRANKMTSEMEQHDMDALREDSAARREDLANRCKQVENSARNADSSIGETSTGE
jgi:hypothetical protein